MAKKVTTTAELALDPDNARRRDNIEPLKKSLDIFGAARSIVIDADNIVRAGNGTVEAAIAAGITKTKIIEAKPDELVVVRRRDLSGERAKAYALADNRTSEMAHWDMDAVEHQLAEFEEFTGEDVGLDEETIAAMRIEFDQRELDRLKDRVGAVEVDDIEVSDKKDAGYKKLEFPCTAEQAKLIRAAVRKAKKAYGVQVTGEALANICEQWVQPEKDSEKGLPA
jgi:sugar phosphate isomerase/epimerase